MSTNGWPVYYVAFGAGTPFANAILKMKAPNEARAREYCAYWFRSYSHIMDADEGPRVAAEYRQDIIEVNDRYYPKDWHRD